MLGDAEERVSAAELMLALVINLLAPAVLGFLIAWLASSVFDRRIVPGVAVALSLAITAYFIFGAKPVGLEGRFLEGHFSDVLEILPVSGGTAGMLVSDERPWLRVLISAIGSAYGTVLAIFIAGTTGCAWYGSCF